VAREVDWHISNPEVSEEATAGGHGTSEYFLIRDFINFMDNGSADKYFNPASYISNVLREVPMLR